jgi:hypothetical protein
LLRLEVNEIEAKLAEWRLENSFSQECRRLSLFGIPAQAFKPLNCRIKLQQFPAQREIYQFMLSKELIFHFRLLSHKSSKVFMTAREEINPAAHKHTRPLLFTAL